MAASPTIDATWRDTIRRERGLLFSVERLRARGHHPARSSLTLSVLGIRERHAAVGAH